jgi:hypothetical protein
VVCMVSSFCYEIYGLASFGLSAHGLSAHNGLLAQKVASTHDLQGLRSYCKGFSRLHFAILPILVL